MKEPWYYEANPRVVREGGNKGEAFAGGLD